MTTERISLMGIFSSETQAASAIRGLGNTDYVLERVHSPIPSHAIAEALNLPKSKVGWFTLVGGIIGFLSGFLLAIFTATRWNIMVSGKPVVALVPFFIVGFEFTILFAVFGNVLGLISTSISLNNCFALRSHSRSSNKPNRLWGSLVRKMF